MLAYFSQTSLHVFVEPSSTIITSKSLTVCRVRLSSNSSTSSGRLKTGTITEYLILILHTLQIAAVAGVNLDEVALVDKQRYTYLNAGLQCCRLGSVCGGIALDARFRVCNLKHSLYRHFSVKNSVCISVADNFHNVALLHEVNTGDEVLGDRNLVVCLLVHEDVVSSVKVEILVGTALYANILESFADVEALLQYTTADNVLQCGTHDSVSLSWLNVQEVNAEIQLAVHTDAGSFLDVL